MIYLFDDTSDLYISKYINTLEFTDVLVHVSAVSGREVKLMEPSLRGAEWIFIHKSFKDSEGGPREVYDYVVNDIADYGDEVPLILFSDEDRPEPQIDRDYKNLIEAYKKSVFYSRLSPFLSDCEGSGIIRVSCPSRPDAMSLFPMMYIGSIYDEAFNDSVDVSPQCPC